MASFASTHRPGTRCGFVFCKHASRILAIGGPDPLNSAPFHSPNGPSTGGRLWEIHARGGHRSCCTTMYYTHTGMPPSKVRRKTFRHRLSAQVRSPIRRIGQDYRLLCTFRSSLGLMDFRIARYMRISLLDPQHGQEASRHAVHQRRPPAAMLSYVIPLLPYAS